MKDDLLEKYFTLYTGTMLLYCTYLYFHSLAVRLANLDAFGCLGNNGIKAEYKTNQYETPAHATPYSLLYTSIFDARFYNYSSRVSSIG